MEGKSKKANQKIVEVEKLDKKVVTLYGKENYDDAWDAVCQVAMKKGVLEIPLHLIPIHFRYLSVNVG